MKNRVQSLTFCVTLMLLSASFARADDFRVGQAFPDLVFPSADTGQPVSLADFRGQKVILHIWASW